MLLSEAEMQLCADCTLSAPLARCHARVRKLPPYFSYFPRTTLMVQRNLVDEGWYRLTAVLIFGVFNGPKRNLNSTTSPRRLFWDFGADQTCTTCWSGGRVHV